MLSRAARIGLLAAAVLLGCKNSGETILVIRASLADKLAGARAGRLLALVKAETGRESSAEFRDRDGPVKFPTSFSLELPRSVSGPVRLEVTAFDQAGIVVAQYVNTRLDLRVGATNDLNIVLGCEDGGCGADGGIADGPFGPGSDGASGSDAENGRCGNSLLEEDELCDPGIPAGRRGACPPADCDDGLDCTRDIPVGSGCRLECRYQEVTEALAGDSCCPARATAADDADCSGTCGGGSLDPGETCDPALAADHPNACPLPGTCDDQDVCTGDELISAGTCSARCAHRPIQSPAAGDGCCPLSASSDSDPDCPVVCGNGRLEPSGGETCDRGFRSSDPEGCPETCPDDGDACTVESLVGSGCQVRCLHTRREHSVGGDGCCLPGVGRAADSDCPAVCGNGVVEPGEFCDRAIPPGGAGACPTTCSSAGAPSCLVPRLEGSAEACTARCAQDVNQLCAQKADGCCPPGCTNASTMMRTDPDCSATCGNGAVEAGETCDTALAPAAPGACPAPAACNDASACTTDRLLSPGTCSARCLHTPVVTFEADGCCPPGGNNLVDVDCPALCGNRVVEESARETCESALPVGAPGACPVGCPSLPPGCLRAAPTGSAQACTARCLLEAIKLCQHGDGCCPPGCTRTADDDCAAVCGNAVLEAGESCDWGIPAGAPGACSFQCDDNNACTVDSALGRTSDCTRSCRHTAVRACLSGDRCCPPECTSENDLDCRPAGCGNQAVEAGETCDPPSSCPTECVDDGDVCTTALLRGDAKTCSAYCTHVPLTTCSGTRADRCCPLGCEARTDVDCGAPPPRPTPF
jgi:hypothetical protein